MSRLYDKGWMALTAKIYKIGAIAFSITMTGRTNEQKAAILSLANCLACLQCCQFPFRVHF